MLIKLLQSEREKKKFSLLSKQIEKKKVKNERSCGLLSQHTRLRDRNQVFGLVMDLKSDGETNLNSIRGDKQIHVGSITVRHCLYWMTIIGYILIVADN